ncbi:MAG: hypothetical protein AAGH15_17745 [Myxococcota bacterium]
MNLATHEDPVELLAALGAPDAFRAWAARRADLETVWASCPRVDWLLALALKAGVERRRVVAAALTCLELAPPRAGSDALELARRWTEREAEGATCWAAGFRASTVAPRLTDRRDALRLRAAAALAFACDDQTDAAYYARRGHVVEAAGLAAASVAPEAAAAMAECVRAAISLRALRRALSATLRITLAPPPPPPAPIGLWASRAAPME